ncbi:hypothetical protein L6164_019827 [Bauhinia variegata]|uniref:Uncharacterized protein n=1 Tax=Bauhinia variegata TaxID=167791 RepID=A0ACB9MT56_BAUVA|nr:hypothetical protein L6164_019827 [Bauhinia variegata]
MASSGSPFSLLCYEGDDSLLQEKDDEDTAIQPINQGFDLDNDKEYIEILFGKEMEFVSQGPPLSPDDMSARLKSLEWIFSTQETLGFQVHTAYLAVTYFDRFFSKRSVNEAQPWGVRLLSLGCLSLAAKMEEQKVPSLCDYPVEDYVFESKTIQDMELLILSCLEWKMGTVTPFAYLHYFFKKFCGQSRPEVIVCRAVEHVLAITKDVNSMDHRPSIIASAAILAAFDGTLTIQTINHRISVISSWGSLESDRVFFCYNLMLEIARRTIIKKTPASDVISTSSSSDSAQEDSSLTSAPRAKRKLDFKEDDEDFSIQKVHRS